MKSPGLLLVSLLWVVHLGSVSGAQESKNLRMLAELHDFVQQSYDVAMAGDHAYVASGMASGLRILDLSNSAAPVEVGYATNDDPCPGVSQWMADRVSVAGAYAYVLYFDGFWSATHYRLYVYDVSDPSAPLERGHLSLPDNCTSLCVAEGFLYVTAFGMTGFSGVKIIDISDPAWPIEAGSFETPGHPHSVAVEGAVAYVADNDALVVYDIRDVHSPARLGRFAPAGEGSLVHEVLVHERHVFLLDAAFGLRVVDASDPAHMREVSAVPHHQGDVYYSRMVMNGDTLCFVRHGDEVCSELVLLDVSRPENPRMLGVFEMPGSRWFYGFDCLAGIACVASGEQGLRVMDLVGATSPCEIGFYQPHGPAFGMAVAGQYAFVSTRRDSQNVVFYDVSDLSSPKEVNTITIEGRPFWLSVVGDRLFVPGAQMNQVPGVRVLDVADPARPRNAGWLPCPPETYGVPLSVECTDRYAFVAMAYGGVQIYDISDLQHPIPLGWWTRWDPSSNQGFAVRNVKVAWPYLFAPDESFGLYVLDISDPAHIVEVARFPTPGAAWWCDVSPDGNYLFLSDFSRGVRVFDISQPLTPKEIGHYEGNLTEVTHLLVSGDSLYVTDGCGIGLRVLDVSTPAAPVEVAYHRTPGVHALDVAVHRGTVFCLDETHLQLFEIIPTPAGVDEAERASVASNYTIESVYPNPFNAAATVIFTLADPGHVTLRVYSIGGQWVKTLVDGPVGPGRHLARFHGDDLASGTYVLHLQVNRRAHAYRVTLLK